MMGSMAERRRSSRLMAQDIALLAGDEDATGILCVVAAVSLVDIARSIAQPVSVSVRSMTSRKV